MKSDQVIDAKGLACPMPIVKTKNMIESMEAGQIVEIHVTDPGAERDFTAWVRSMGHELLSHIDKDGVYTFWIRKKKG